MDTLMNNALVGHDISAQDDAALGDSLHIKTPIALCALIQNQCTLKEYDINMESLGMLHSSRIIVHPKSMA